MLAALDTIFGAMSFVEELHTIGFTVFVVAGAVCCLFSSGQPGPTPGPKARC